MAAVAETGIASEERMQHHLKDQDAEFRRDVRKLVDLLSKLNPLAKEFVPASQGGGGEKCDGKLSADAPVFVASGDLNNCNGSSKDSCSDGSSNNQLYRKKRNGFGGKRKINERIRRAEREDSIKRTVYVSDIGHHVTEEKLAEMFSTCGQVVDCRICGDPHSALRFAFIEFSDDEGATAALNLCGTMIGFYPIRVLPSKTAILPVNPKFLPRSEDEKEMVVRTVYCTNIDKKVTQNEVKNVFEHLCGEVSRLRLLGDNIHSTRIAFIEFVLAESAIIALNCSGMLLGDLPVRVSPSKTPVRPRIARGDSK